MHEAFKLSLWLRLHGNSAPWEEVERQFKAAFPESGSVPQSGKPRLTGLMLSNRGLPMYGKTSK